MFIWGRQPGGPSVEPFHEPHGTNGPIRVGTDLGAFCAWWPSEEISVGALQSRFYEDSGSSRRRREGTDSVCLRVPETQRFTVKRTSNSPEYYLVDHTIAKGGVPSNFACPGFKEHLPIFDTEWAEWVGCNHKKFPSWTGYVCKHPGTDVVALKCFLFEDLAGCNIGEKMPCPPQADDVGCKGGLMPGEMCTHACPDGKRSTALLKTQERCPLDSPQCVTVCPEQNVPLAPAWAPFWLSWDWEKQEATVFPKNEAHVCFPETLECGNSFLLARCRPKTCGALPWAGIFNENGVGTVISPQCPTGEQSGAPIITCGQNGKWSHEKNACRLVRASNIITDRSECVHNERLVTRDVIDAGFPPVVPRGIEKWVEPCVSQPPKCCQDKGLYSSYGYYTLDNIPNCHCHYAHLGFAEPAPCCSFKGTLSTPPLVFFPVFTGNLQVLPCKDKICSATDCYSNPAGCLAFNETHLATWAPELGELRNAFSWDF